MINVTSSIDPEHADHVHETLSRAGLHEVKVQFGGGYDGPNAQAEQQSFTIEVRAEDLSAVNSALADIGCPPPLVHPVGEGAQAMPLDEYLSRIEWR